MSVASSTPTTCSKLIHPPSISWFLYPSTPTPVPSPHPPSPTDKILRVLVFLFLSFPTPRPTSVLFLPLPIQQPPTVSSPLSLNIVVLVVPHSQKLFIILHLRPSNSTHTSGQILDISAYHQQDRTAGKLYNMYGRNERSRKNVEIYISLS